MQYKRNCASDGGRQAGSCHGGFVPVSGNWDFVVPANQSKPRERSQSCDCTTPRDRNQSRDCVKSCDHATTCDRTTPCDHATTCDRNQSRDCGKSCDHATACDRNQSRDCNQSRDRSQPCDRATTCDCNQSRERTTTCDCNQPRDRATTRDCNQSRERSQSCECSQSRTAHCPAKCLTGMVNVDRQQLNDLYDAEHALLAGTLFPELHKPMNGYWPCEGNCADCGQEAAFVVWELRLYLNTHPCDADALQLMHRLTREACDPNYATAFLPDDCGAWRWTDNPWPWEYSCQCGD